MGGSHIEVDAKFAGKRSIYTHAVDCAIVQISYGGNLTCGGNFVSGNY